MPDRRIDVDRWGNVAWPPCMCLTGRRQEAAVSLLPALAKLAAPSLRPLCQQQLLPPILPASAAHNSPSQLLW